MSHTNQTANYHLPQFIGTDKPAWLVDVNQAMADIDAQMKANETASATAEADAQSALSGVGALNSQVSSLQSSVTALETAQPLDEAQIETNRQNIATNAQNIVSIDNRLGHVDISDVGSSVTDAIKKLDDAQPGDMTGATSSDAGVHGLVPAPSAGDENKYLKGDGTWGTVSSNDYREIHTTNSNQTFSAQLTELGTYFNTLSADEKRKSAIIQITSDHEGAIYRMFNAEAQIFGTFAGGTTYINVVTFRLSTHNALSVQLSNTSALTDLTSQTNEYALKLVVLY